MEYKFCLTPRLIALALFSGIALMVLLFALGYQVGKNMAPPPVAANGPADEAQRRAAQKLEAAAAAAAAPLAAPARSLQKAIK